MKEPALPIAVGIITALTLGHLNPLNQCFVIVAIAVVFYEQLLLLLAAIAVALVYQTPVLETLKEGAFFSVTTSWLHDWIGILYDKQLAPFFSTLFLGESPGFYLSYTFQSVGLSHLLAISGFHFQALIATADLFISKIAKERSYLIALILIACGYIAIVQLSPSVLRSFIALQIALFAPLKERIYSAKNTLYFSFIVIFFLMPDRICGVGCSLSFLATFGILHYAGQIRRFLETLWVTESVYPEKIRLNYVKKIFSQIVSLNIAVMLTTVPFILLKTGQYPLISILMNLFMPTLLLPALFLFLLSLPLPFIAPINSWYTKKILSILEIVPRSFTFEWICPTSLTPLLETILVAILLFPLLRSCVKSTKWGLI